MVRYNALSCGSPGPLCAFARAAKAAIDRMSACTVFSRETWLGMSVGWGVGIHQPTALTAQCFGTIIMNKPKHAVNHSPWRKAPEATTLGPARIGLEHTSYKRRGPQ